MGASSAFVAGGAGTGGGSGTGLTALAVRTGGGINSAAGSVFDACGINVVGRVSLTRAVFRRREVRAAFFSGRLGGVPGAGAFCPELLGTAQAITTVMAVASNVCFDGVTTSCEAGGAAPITMVGAPSTGVADSVTLRAGVVTPGSTLLKKLPGSARRVISNFMLMTSA